MKVVIIGATGMVGHILFSEFSRRNIDVIGIGRRESKNDIMKFDIHTEWEQVRRFLKDGNFDAVINCSAILVNESEINRLQSVYINSFLPHLLVDLFRASRTKVIHLSTGGVFSGEDEFYFEDSQLSPPTFYGITKAAGEFNNDKDLVIRSDFWGPDNKKNGIGLFNWFLNQDEDVSAYTKVFFNGISNVELARLVLGLMDYAGIVHIGVRGTISKCDFLKKIKNVFNLDNITLISNSTVRKNVFLKSKRVIPYVNDIDTIINDVYQYLMDNHQYYADIYPQIYKN
jgi:dTDP-4-dehydrorhamnose reductase